MNNSVFSKALENIINRVDIRLISSDKVAQKLAASQTLIVVRSSMKTSGRSREKDKALLE